MFRRNLVFRCQGFDGKYLLSDQGSDGPPTETLASNSKKVRSLPSAKFFQKKKEKWECCLRNKLLSGGFSGWTSIGCEITMKCWSRSDKHFTVIGHQIAKKKKRACSSGEHRLSSSFSIFPEERHGRCTETDPRNYEKKSYKKRTKGKPKEKH